MKRWVYKDLNDNFVIQDSDTKPNSMAQKVDDSLINEPIEFLVISESSYTNEFNKKIPVYNVSLDQGSKDADALAKQKEQQRRQASDELDVSLAVKAIQASGTTNLIASLTDYLTYMSMVSHPERYDKEGIVAKKATLTYAKGDALDTIAKVTEYATECMDEAEAYFITRMKDISNHINQGGE